MQSNNRKWKFVLLQSDFRHMKKVIRLLVIHNMTTLLDLLGQMLSLKFLMNLKGKQCSGVVQMIVQYIKMIETVLLVDFDKKSEWWYSTHVHQQIKPRRFHKSYHSIAHVEIREERLYFFIHSFQILHRMVSRNNYPKSGFR